MSRKYLILPRVEYRGANAMPAWWCTGAPGPMAARGFAGALAIAIGGRDAIRWLRGASVVHHDVTLRAERIGRRLYPHQLRAASLVSKDDYAGSSGTALSSQPTVRCDGVASLVCAFAEDAPIDAGAVENFLRRARFAGGTVADHGFVASKPLIAGSLREAATCVRSGFSFHDRTDLLVPRQGESDPLDAFLRATRREKRPTDQLPGGSATEQQAAGSPAEGPEAWLQPYLVGYRALTALDPAARSRDGHPHAFAEPLVGLAQLVSLRSKGLSLWDYSSVHGLYAVSQTH
jgi:CRISPR type I-F-associated protein Csy2